MAGTLILKRSLLIPAAGTHFTVQTTETQNLLTGNLRVAVDGWQLNYAPGDGDAIWDSFGLIGRGTSDSELGTTIFDIQEYISDARRSASNNSNNDEFWVHYKTNDGKEVRTFATDGSFSLESDPGKGGLGPLMANDGYVRSTLAIQHIPAWEGTSTSDTTLSNMNVCGSIAWGTAFPPSGQVGDLDSRITGFSMTGMANSTYLDDIWVGIRPTYNGTTSFKSWWQCEDGTALATGGASVVPDGAASGGSAVRVDFSGTSSMIQRMRISVSHMSGTAEHFVGKYLVLGRLKCGTSTECLIDLYQGLRQVNYSGSPQGIEMVGETKVTNNLYKLVELGQVQIPPFGMRLAGTLGDELIGHSTMYIFAQRLSGTSYLYLDALCLVPCEHMLAVKNAGMGTSVDYLSYYCGPHGDHVATMRQSGGNAEIIEHSVNDFNWPADGGLVVVAAQQAGTTAHDLSVNADITFNVYGRWSMIKP